MRHAIVLASLFLSAGSALGDAGPGSDAARAPMTYTLPSKWKGLARAAGLVQRIGLDATGVTYWHVDGRGGASTYGGAVVLYPDGTARLTCKANSLFHGTYRWLAPGRVHLRFRIWTYGGIWLWNLEYAGPGTWRARPPPAD
jgi:hypothetical protein